MSNVATVHPKHWVFCTMPHIYAYYVGFMSICNGIIGAGAVGLPVLFTDWVKVTWSGGALSYLEGD